jgi:hypothetical protein
MAKKMTKRLADDIRALYDLKNDPTTAADLREHMVALVALHRTAAHAAE